MCYYVGIRGGPTVIRTTIMLPATLKARAHQRARELGVSFGELVRESLAHAVAPDPREDPLFFDEAVFDGDAPADLAADHDRHLYPDGP